MYLNLIQIAESFGVSETVVKDWIRNEGLPHVPDSERILFDRNQVATWAATRGLAAKVGFLAQENPVFATGWQLEPLLRTGGVWREVPSTDIFKVIEKVVDSLPAVAPQVRTLLMQRIKAKDGITWASVGGGFAMPHMSARVSLGRASGTLSLITLSDSTAISEEPVDGVPLRHLFFFIAPTPRAHLDLLCRLSRVLSRGVVRELVLHGAADSAIYAALAAADTDATGTVTKEQES